MSSQYNHTTGFEGSTSSQNLPTTNIPHPPNNLNNTDNKGESKNPRTSIIKIREKLIFIFLVVKILPLILLAVIAWHSLVLLGTVLQETSVKDSRDALTALAINNIERMTTDTAQKVAEFLYSRDADIEFLAKALGHFDYNKKENLEEINGFFRDFDNSKTRLVRRHGDWKVADDGMSWVQVSPYVSKQETGKRSRNAENEEVIDGAGFQYRSPYGFGDSRSNFVSVPIYDEIALIDLNGNQIARYATPRTTKKRHTFSSGLANIADPKNTYINAEHYFSELQKLGAKDVYVSDVIGAYTPCRFVGMYTPDYMASKNYIVPKIAELEKKLADIKNKKEAEKAAELIWKLRVLNAELINAGEQFNSRADYNRKVRAEIDRRIGKEKNWEIKNKNYGEIANALDALGLNELAAKVRNVELEWHPEEEGYAGAENPLGVRFEGIVRWAKAVFGEDGKVKGYVTFAMNHDHLLDMLAHITPMSSRYNELSNAFDGNYAFIWDYECRSIVHPRHHSIYGFNPETGVPETPWLESALYNDMIEAGYKRQDWQQFIATLKDYVPWTGDDNSASLAHQSRTKKPAPELTKAGLVGLDGRYLNNAPQCTGWMDLTRDGGSGSLFILWSGVYKANTAAAIPYYTGQYAPEVRGNRRGFGFVSIGCGIDDFSEPAEVMGDKMEAMVNVNLRNTSMQLTVTTVLLSVLVVFVAIWMASYLSNRLQWLIHGISEFRSGARHFRFHTDRLDEFGQLAASFDDMADNIVSSVHAPLVITDSNLRITYANDYFLTLKNKELGGVVGQYYYTESIYPYGSEYCPVTVLLEEKEGKASVWHDKNSDRYFQGEANYFINEHGNRIGYVITSSDVTDISLQQLELKKAKDIAETVSKHKSDFLARMSHELRTPLNAIMGMNGIVQSKILEVLHLSEYSELNESLEQVKVSFEHFLSLINDILDLSNLESGRITLTEQPTNIKALFEDITGIAQLHCADRQLKLITQIDDFAPSYFFTDGLRLRQVLNHLLMNAVKFSFDGGEVDFIVKREKRRDGKSLLSFTVRDTGIGIPQEKQQSIFYPFEQGGSADITKREYGGSGLGLALVKKILLLFGSEIKLKSTVGKGSEFSFAVWLKEETGEDRPETGDVTGKFAGQRALVIDDVVVNRIVLVSLLKKAGFTIDEAQNGEEGLRTFEKSPENTYSVVFMDIQMPVMDGYESAAAIRLLDREDARTIPIVAISANAFQEDIDKSLASGMNSHHPKPIKVEALASILMTYCKPTRE